MTLEADTVSAPQAQATGADGATFAGERPALAVGARISVIATDAYGVQAPDSVGQQE